MTFEEVKEKLEVWGGCCSNNEAYIACHKAMEAIEKQIPKKPRKYKANISLFYFECPMCEIELVIPNQSEGEIVCPRCKEKLPVPTKKTAPCKDCEERDVGCHATCAKYSAWQKKHIAELAEIRKIKTVQGQLDDSVREKAYRTRKRKGLIK